MNCFATPLRLQRLLILVSLFALNATGCANEADDTGSLLGRPDISGKIADGILGIRQLAQKTDSATPNVSTPGKAAEPSSSLPTAPATQPKASSPTGTSCADIQVCGADCEDATCWGACVEAGTPDARELDTLLWTCVSQGQCEDVECVQDSCWSELQACLVDSGDTLGPETPNTTPSTDDGMSCGEIQDCGLSCDDSACWDGCIAGGDPEARQLDAQLWTCIDQNGCETFDCTEQACGGELNACLGSRY